MLMQYIAIPQKFTESKNMETQEVLYFKQKNKTNGEQSSQVPLYYWCVHFATESDKKHLKSMWHIQLGLLLVGTAALIAWSTWLEG